MYNSVTAPKAGTSQSRLSGAAKLTVGYNFLIEAKLPLASVMTYANLHLLDHPLARHYLSVLRDARTPPTQFRAACKRITLLLAVEAAQHHLQEQEREIETPNETTRGLYISGPQIAVPILRAGLGMLDPIVELFPEVSVGYIGLARDETTAVAASYYSNLPVPIGSQTVFLLDPMLATGGSAAQACDLLKSSGAANIVMLSIVAAPAGVQLMLDAHPNVAVYTAALDRGLNDRKYIVPGLGDFGDRLYGT